MKKLSLLLSFLFLFYTSFAQFNVSLTGNPINTNGWIFGGNSFVNGANFTLTNPVGNQAGYIYYGTPTDLTTCGQFQVDFDFQVIPTGCTADGIAFWYISNPPVGFISGGGIGLPNNPNGLLLVLDTYDNDGNGNNPLATLLGYTGTTNYTEGDPTGVLGNIPTNQGFIEDGNYHHCEITYLNGTVNVYFNNSPTASITATYGLNQTGYFGFSASTGACTSTQNIKNVSIISSATTLAPTVVSPVTYCQYETPVALTATGTNLTWFTSIGGTPLPGAPTPNTNVPGTTTYYVTQNPSGVCPSPPDSIKVIVNAKPAPPAIIGDTVYCPNSVAAPLSATGQNILWYTSNPGIGTATAPTVNTNAPGHFTYYATQTVNGCTSDYDSVKLNVYNGPTPLFTYHINYGCVQDSVVFTNVSANAVSYTWDFGDGATDNVPSPTHIFTQQGIYTVKLTATSSHGCTDVYQQTVNLIHPIMAAFGVSSDTVCAGTPINFTSTSTGNGLSYNWDFGDGTNSFIANPTHTYVQGGVFTPTLTVTDIVPCKNAASTPVYIGSIAVNIAFRDTTICPVDSITILTSLATPVPQLFTSYHYAWTPADGLGSDTVATPNFMAFGDYTYDLMVTALPLGCIGYDTATIHSFAHSKMTNITTDQTIQYGSSIQLNANGAEYYFWTPDDGSLDNPNINYPLATPTQPTIYVVHGIDIHGCLDSEMVNIKIDYTMTQFIPSAFSPNGDGRNDYFRILNLKYQKLLDFRVYNRWGQEVFQTQNGEKGWDGTFNGTPQETGVYNYIIILAFPDATEKTYTGTITLIR